MRKLFLLFIILITTGATFSAMCHATVYFSCDNESFTVDQNAPADPYNFEYGVPSGATRLIKQSANTNVSKYLELYVAAATDSFYYAQDNDAGSWSATVWDSGSPLSLSTSTMYYLAFLFNFTRTGGIEIFPHDYAANKGMLLMGGGTAVRAGVGFGYWQWGNYISGKYSVILKCNNGIDGDDYADNTFRPNQNGYSETNNYPLEYDTWYSAVAGFRFTSASTGAVRLWIDGTLVVSYDNVRTSDSSSPQLEYIENGATIAQNDYDCPIHRELFDRVTFTNSVSDIDGTGGTYNFFASPITQSGVGNISNITIGPGVSFR